MTSAPASVPARPTYLLTLTDHGGADREHRLYGGALASRYLSVTGRWVATGSEAVPILSWGSEHDAKAAAATATASRGRPVGVVAVVGQGFGCFAPYGPAHAGALCGYLPFSAAAARKLEVERRKLMGYARVVLAGAAAGSANDPEAAMLAMKAAARELREAGVGNGSWVSAAQGLTGRRTRQLFELVADGELQCDPGLAPVDIWNAMQMATVLVSQDPLPRAQ